jgi:hypothetical protein
MPFRLTYCGRNAYNCTDSLQGWGTLPGITQQQIDEVGMLQYLAGVGEQMYWIAARDTSASPLGSYGDTEDFAQSLVDYFYYSSDFTFWNNTAIQGNTSGFKQAISNSLNNSRPVLFRYSCHANGGGHLVVIDGYENDEFFHFIEGEGGWEDAYYYLFANDDDEVHLPRPHIELWGLNSVVDLHPDCPSGQDVSILDITITAGEGELFQSGNNLTVNNFTIEDNGAAVLRANNTITLSSNFEVELGGQIFIVSQPCRN